jgi:hypothetical protein
MRWRARIASFLIRQKRGGKKTTSLTVASRYLALLVKIGVFTNSLRSDMQTLHPIFPALLSGSKRDFGRE